jgi:hypothetical protein
MLDVREYTPEQESDRLAGDQENNIKVGSQLPLSIDRNSRKDGDDYDIFGNLNHRKC